MTIAYMPLALPLLIGAGMILLVKGITFFSAGTDNEKQALAASNSGKWTWPSDMHKYSEGKTYMKDMVVILLSFVQKAVRDKRTDYPLVVLCILSNVLSASLVYLIAYGIWRGAIASFLMLLFLFSLWPWQIALMGGHICLGQAFSLLSVYFLLLAINMGGAMSAISYLFSGIVFVFSQFSSASSRKYLPVIFAAFIYVIAYTGAHIILVLLFVCAGSLFALAFLLLPDIMKNIRGYYSYVNIAKYYGHFRLYRNYFSSIGKPIDDNMRGAGLIWILKYFVLIMPVQLFLLLISFVVMTGALLSGSIDMRSYLDYMLLVLVGISPIIFGEVTRGPQLGRSYFPSLATFLLPIGYFYMMLGLASNLLSIAVPLMVLIARDSFVFFSDVYPSRMAPKWLRDELHSQKPEAIYSYMNNFNESLLKVIDDEELLLKTKDISSLKEISDNRGVVVIPGTSSKALNMESMPEGYDKGDFTDDQVLNELLDSKEIEKLAIKKLKTFGTSRIWVHESEVSSYRDLILGEIGEKDIYRGYAWIIPANKIRERLCLQ